MALGSGREKGDWNCEWMQIGANGGALGRANGLGFGHKSCNRRAVGLRYSFSPALADGVGPSVPGLFPWTISWGVAQVGMVRTFGAGERGTAIGTEHVKIANWGGEWNHERHDSKRN